MSRPIHPNAPIPVTHPGATYRAMRQRDPTLPHLRVNLHDRMGMYADSDASIAVSRPEWDAAKRANQNSGLVFMLAHEASHVRHKDHSRYRGWQQLADNVTQLGGGVGASIGGGVALRRAARGWQGAGHFGRTIGAVGTLLAGGLGLLAGKLVGWGGASLWVNGKKRQVELRADREALETLKRLGYDPSQTHKAAREFLGEDTPYCQGLEVLTCTHPRPSQRLSALEAYQSSVMPASGK